MNTKPWAEGEVLANGLPIHFYRTGQSDQPPLLLIHGFTDNGLCWTRVAQAFEHHFDIIMVDARNHGQSGSGDAHLEVLAKDHAAVIDQLKLGPTTVLGHSVGANVAAKLAGDFPQLVSQLILEDPPWRDATDQNDEASGDKAKARNAAFRKYVDSIKKRTATDIMEEGRRRHHTWHADEFPPWVASNQQVHRDAMSSMDMGPWQPLVEGITCPTFLLHADGDGIVTPEIATLVSHQNPNVRTLLVENAGHNLRREQFEIFATEVGRFLSVLPNLHHGDNDAT